MKKKSKCRRCMHKRDIIACYERIRCVHPKVIMILETLSERKPGLIAATALNRIGKLLKLKIDPTAYTNPCFKFPFCYRSEGITRCSGFEKPPNPVKHQILSK